MLAVCCPRSALCEPYVGPMFAYVSRMWPQVGKPALRVHGLVPKRPNSSRNPAQHAFPAQRSLTLCTDALKKQSFCHTYPLQKPALRVHWLVPKRPNSSRNPAQHAFPAQRSLTLCTDALKKQSFCHTYPLQKPALRVHWLVPKRPNSSRNRAQHAFPAQRPGSLTLRTDALKKQSFCHTYPLQKPALRVHWLVPKRPNSSRNHARRAFPAQRPESLTLSTDALKKQSFCHTYPLQKPALRVHWLVPKRPNSSRNRAQHAFPAQRPESLTLHTDVEKKTKLMPHLCHTYPLQEPALRVHWLVDGWLRNSRTAAIAETSFESPFAGCERANGKESCRMASASVPSRSIGLGRLLWRAPPM